MAPSPPPSAKRREPSTPVRSSHTSASDASSRPPELPDAEPEEVRVNRPSPLTASARPPSSSGVSSSLRIPAAPMLIVRSAVSASWRCGVTVTSPDP